MELRFYLQTLLRQRYVIILTVLVCMVFGNLYGSFMMDTEYNGSVFFTIAYRDDQQTEDYKIGNYWANQASIEFARTVSGWPKNPRLIDEIYSTAGVNMAEDINFLGKLMGPISVKRVERANISLRFSSSSIENAGKIADSIISVFETKIAEYNNEVATNYRITGAYKSFEEKKPDPWVMSWVGAIIGLILGIIFAYLVEFFRGVITHPEQVEEITKTKRFDAISSNITKKDIAFTAGYYKSNPLSTLLVGGIGVNPNRFVKKLTGSLADSYKALDIVDATSMGVGLHKLFGMKTSRVAKDASATQIKKGWKEVPKADHLSLYPRLTGGPVPISFLSYLLQKKPTIITCTLPNETAVMDQCNKDEVLLLVQLGKTRKELLTSVIQYLGDRSYKIVIIK